MCFVPLRLLRQLAVDDVLSDFTGVLDPDRAAERIARARNVSKLDRGTVFAKVDHDRLLRVVLDELKETLHRFGSEERSQLVLSRQGDRETVAGSSAVELVMERTGRKADSTLLLI